MKTLTLSVLLLSYYVVFCENAGKIEKQLNGNISSENSTKTKTRSKTNLFSIETESELIEKEFSEVRRNEHGPISERSLRGGDDNLWIRQLNTSSILIFDSVENFKATVGDIKWLSNKKFRYAHLVYIPGVTASDILDIIKDGFAIDKVNFLMNVTSDSIELAASFMFTESKCRDNQLVTINQFSRHNMKWNGSTFYPDKYSNLHGCKLTTAGHRDWTRPWSFYMREISRSLNFVPNETENTLEEALNDTHVDLLAYPKEFDGDENYITGATLFIDNYVFIVPPGEPYSALEKMFIMFDVETWIAIAGTFTFFLVAIQVINMCSVTVQNFVYGRNIQTPTLNVFDIFLNGGQRQVPGRNFARFILILFIIWSLIIRTCYQSMMFEYLQADMRKAATSSLDDMGVSDEWYGWSDDVEADRIKLCSTRNWRFCGESCGESYNECHKFIVPEPANKAYMIISEMHIRFIFNQELSSGIPSFVVLEEHFRTLFLTVPFKPFCPFYETFDSKLQLFNENGIPLHVYQLTFETTEKREKLNWRFEDTGPMVLTLEHLKIGFVAWGIMLAISSLVFLIELGIRSGRNCRRLMIRVAIIRTFLEGWLHFW